MTAEMTPHISVEEYLEGEKVSAVRHEYVRGQVFSMAGATDAHEAIVVNLVALIRNRLRQTHCRGYAGGMKARIEALDTFYYPDFMVSCDARDLAAPLFKRYPRVILEVPSSSTEAFDRGQKFEHYRTLDSIEEYVLVAQDRIHVDVYRCQPGNEWLLTSISSGEILRLESLDFTCEVDALYEDVTSERPAEGNAGETRCEPD